MKKTLEDKLDARRQQLETITKKLNKVPGAINIFSDKLFYRNRASILKQSLLEKVTKVLTNIAGQTIRVDDDKVRKLKRFVRKTTVPINVPEFILGKPKRKTGNHYILAHGIHYIYALPGGGKSSLLYDLFEEIRVTTGLGSYINAAIEKPRYDNINDRFYRYHAQFEVEDFFGKVLVKKKDKEEKWKIMQLQQFDKRFRNIGFDELLSWLNHRLNNTGDYLEVFIALIEFLAQRRHRHIDRAYFLNQLDTTDIQLMSSFNYIHEVQVDLDIPYAEWVETGEYTYHIMGWWIDTYTYAKTGKKTADNKVLVESHYRPRTADFEYFETLSQSHKNDGLPFHRIDGLYKGD